MPATADYRPHSMKEDIAYREEAKAERQQQQSTEKGEPSTKAGANGKKTPSRKRKAPPSDAPAKRTRRTKVDPIAALRYLVSNDAVNLTISPDEQERAAAHAGKPFKTYISPDLSPFEVLLCTMVLARPISHRLQARAIATLLNEPYSFNTPESLADVEDERIWEALAEARTQHKVKTAESLGAMARVIVDRFSSKKGDGSMTKLREEAEFDASDERDILVKAIKSFGVVGAAILCRRLQAVWPEHYPCADKRALSAVQAFGLPASSAEELAQFVSENGEAFGVKKADDAMLRQAFVAVLDHAVGIELEGKLEEAIHAINQDATK